MWDYKTLANIWIWCNNITVSICKPLTRVRLFWVAYEPHWKRIQQSSSWDSNLAMTQRKKTNSSLTGIGVHVRCPSAFPQWNTESCQKSALSSSVINRSDSSQCFIWNLVDLLIFPWVFMFCSFSRLSAAQPECVCLAWKLCAPRWPSVITKWSSIEETEGMSKTHTGTDCSRRHKVLLASEWLGHHENGAR